MIDGVNSGNGLVGDGNAVSGFLGALFAGFVAGIVVQLLKKAFSWMPKAMDGIKPVFVLSAFGHTSYGLDYGRRKPCYRSAQHTSCKRT